MGAKLFKPLFDVGFVMVGGDGTFAGVDLLPLLKQGDSQYRYWVFPNSTRLAYAD